VQLNEAAKALLLKAKNRMNKFYNPAMYKAPEPVKLSEEDRLFQNAGGDLSTPPPEVFIQLAVDAPEKPEAPETYGEHKKKTEGSNSILALMDMLVADVEKQLQEAHHTEKTAKRDYAALTADAKETREADSATIARDEGAKAEAEGKLQEAKEQHSLTSDNLTAVNSYIQDLHASCDFLTQNYDLRLEARTNEREGLENAKAVLYGADYN